jgi:mycothiol synthase
VGAVSGRWGPIATPDKRALLDANRETVMTDRGRETTIVRVSDVEVRPITEHDADAVASLGERRRAQGAVWDEPDSAAPGFLAEVANRLAGVGWIEWWEESDGTHLYLLLGFVDPELRARGVGRALLGVQEEWARRHGRDRGVAQVTFGGNAEADRPAGQRLLLEAGYEVAFTVVEMERPVPPLPVLANAPEGYDLGVMDERHHQAVHALVEESFGSSRFGAVARSYEDYLEEVAAAPSGLDLWRLAWHGDQLAGVVVTTLTDDVGETPWLAVAPEHRGRGVGEALMGAGLGALAERGARTTRLTTIAESPYRSVALYERVGYRVVARLPRYRKSSA